MAIIIDGKAVSAEIRKEISDEIREKGISACLAVVIVGDDPASQIYVRNKHKACEDVGIKSEVYTLPAETDEKALLELIDALNSCPTVDGILVQMPLPKHINPVNIINRINPEKDVDAFHPANVGKIVNGKYSFLPCTPAGIMELIKHYGIETDGKNCVVIGRSDIVGKPMALLMLHANATVTVCHSHTKNLTEICKNADIIVCAIGKSEFLKADMVKDGAVVIDVGINRDENGKLHGDVAFAEVAEKASYITPVPGGVGPMTITMLLKNTLAAAKSRK